MTPVPEIAIIGAGAAGCFCAAVLAEALPGKASITIYESGKKPLAKVAVTGGGRCNLTNSFRDISIEKAYPRGATLMKRLMRGFSNDDACRWFTSHGVELLTQEDQCVFPVSQDAMQIVNTLLGVLKVHRVKIVTGAAVKKIEPGFRLLFDGAPAARADYVAVTAGGLSSGGMLGLFDGLDLKIQKPVPSLFTFKTDSPIKELTGAVTESVMVSLEGTRFSAAGPLLITDWGFSGPAVLKLSSYGARLLAENGYKATLAVNWMYGETEQEMRGWLEDKAASAPQKNISNIHPQKLTSRLWIFLLNKAGIKENIKFATLNAKMTSRLCATLLHDCYTITGRARFKDEFVTCGGIDLGEVSASTLEVRKYPGLYFAGEVLDIDAITGGFNLQAAWTTGYTVAGSIGRALKKE